MIKKIFFFISVAFFFIACNTATDTIIVTNSNPELDRNNEMVEIQITDLKSDFTNSSFILKDEKGVEVPYQIIKENSTPVSLIFQASVPAGSSVKYILKKGKPAEVKAKTSARFVPERSDDFAWENDFMCYRLYGPGSAKWNSSNGMDLFFKRTGDLMVDNFYHEHLVNNNSYHIDHGMGLDCYIVGNTLGAGSIAPYTSKLWVGKTFDHYEVLENGPLRSKFTLVYDSVKVDSVYLKETLTITVDAGRILNKAEVRYEGENIPMQLAGGIFTHDGKGARLESKDGGIIGYAEDATDERGTPAGRNYVGIYMPGDSVTTRLEGNHLLILNDRYNVGSDFTYYFGSGWSEWQFPNDLDWFNALFDFSTSLEEPLSVTIQ